MIPGIAAQSVHQALSAKPAPIAHADFAAASAARGTTGNTPSQPSIASDLGQLTTDTLSLLGLGAPAGGNPLQAAQAYASSGTLLQ